LVKSELEFREGRSEDLWALVQMLADDELGKLREKPQHPLDDRYIKAFDAIDRDPNQSLIVVFLGQEIIGMFQLSFIPGLSRLGAMRGQIESVRIASCHRGHGYGKLCFEWAINRCREKGCDLIQLTSDITRTDAHRFYEDLGFVASHTGYKLKL
jgi:GNAT superfamily N-acetyltransferase